MSSSPVLLLVDPVHPAPAATMHAVQAARGGRLVALVVLDPEALRPVDRRMGDTGIVGNEQRKEIVEALAAEHRELAAARLAEVAAAAARGGVPFEPVVREGDFVETCAAEIRARGIGVVVVPSRRRSRLARLFGETRLDALEARCACRFDHVGE